MDPRISWNVYENRYADSDQGVATDRHALFDAGAGSDVRPFLDRDPAGQYSTRCDVNVVADSTVVVDAGRGVDQCVDADDRACLNNRSSHDLCAVTHGNVFGHNSGRVNQRGEVIARGMESFEDPPSCSSASDGAHAVCHKKIFRTVLEDFFVVTENRHAETLVLANRQTWIAYAEDIHVQQPEGIEYNGSVTPTTQENDWSKLAQTGSLWLCIAESGMGKSKNGFFSKSVGSLVSLSTAITFSAAWPSP